MSRSAPYWRWFPDEYDNGATGNVTRIDLKDGAWNEYRCDVLDRLVCEANKASGGTVNWARKYFYDAVGNRTRLEKFGGATTEATTYQYNNLNQLTSYVVRPSGGSGVT